MLTVTAGAVMKIAVLGIGFMGFPMARRLCEAGHEVHAQDHPPGQQGLSDFTDASELGVTIAG